MQQLLAFDTWLFYLINHLPHGWFLDGIFSTVSGLGDSGFIWFIIGIWLILREEKRDKRFFLPIGIAGIASWVMSELVLKSLVVRLRPSNILDDVRVVGFPNGYSFPSTHTTFAFALAFVLAAKEPRLKKYFYLLAVAVGFSRIYLGYHYPADVFAGAGTGFLIGYFTMYWYRQWRKGTSQFVKKPAKSPKRKAHSTHRRRR